MRDPGDTAAFLSRHRLPAKWQAEAEQFFDPLCDSIARRCSTQPGLVLGINGCQGSGKSTLADYVVRSLQRDWSLSAIALSIDDFYLPRSDRLQLAIDIHPLLATRGVPGTHDCALARSVLHSLKYGAGSLAVPRFDKRTDDRDPHWEQVQAPVDCIVLEGWCVGIAPQSSARLTAPVNALERDEDPQGLWRNYVNSCLAGDYQQLFAELDLTVMLAAPGFDCVYAWRLEQEQKMQRAGSRRDGMSATEIRRFVQHYQRLTEHALGELPARADLYMQLNARREIIACRGSLT